MFWWGDMGALPLIRWYFSIQREDNKYFSLLDVCVLTSECFYFLLQPFLWIWNQHLWVIQGGHFWTSSHQRIHHDFNYSSFDWFEFDACAFQYRVSSNRSVVSQIENDESFDSNFFFHQSDNFQKIIWKNRKKSHEKEPVKPFTWILTMKYLQNILQPLEAYYILQIVLRKWLRKSLRHLNLRSKSMPLRSCLTKFENQIE